MSERFLILGASGQLGSEFVKVLQDRGIDFLAPQEEAADITNFKKIGETALHYRPTVVVNCAAYNAVDAAEDNSEAAFRVNAEAVSNLAELCRQRGSLLVHYSSDYVFDGEKGGFYIESDAPNPLNEYGKSKLAGEKAIQSVSSEYLIFRLSWVIGRGKQNFLHKVAGWAADGRTLRISCDETSVPTFADEIVDVSLKAVKSELRGLFHLVSGGYASRYEMTRYFMKKIGLTNIVIPTPVAYFNMPARRPLFSVMSNKTLSRSLNIELPSWEEGIDRYAQYFR